MAYSNGKIYVVYRTTADNEDRIIMAKSNNNGGFDNIVVSCYPSETILDVEVPATPTLWIDNVHIVIMFSHNSKLFMAESYNDGTDFQTSLYENSFDAEPFYYEHAGHKEVFVSKQDKYQERYYQDFTHDGMSMNNTPIFFNGTDIRQGAVRSNSDIWLKQMGGGSNNGWPTFYGPVYTSGHIISTSGTPPLDNVFRGGHYENVDMLSIDYEALEMLTGSHFYIGNAEENCFTFLDVLGNSYHVRHNSKITIGRDTMDVWTNYPPPSGMYLFRNNVAHTDTVMVDEFLGTNTLNTLYCDTPLYIKGTFSGKWLIYCTKDIYIIDDILLSNTPVGSPPTDNQTDSVILISGGRIIIQYGYMNFTDLVRYKPNCDGNVYIYSNLIALNQNNDGFSQHDGMFTFEYQHPHPSTTAKRIGNIVFKNIDLHLHHYPQREIYPWPANKDYPWYNPLWPEEQPYLERGTVHAYGSIYQYRRGFLHRSLLDTEYSNPNGVWNVDLDLCGGISSGVNAPGTTGSGVGYIKDLNADLRSIALDQIVSPFGYGIKVKTSTDGENWELDYYHALNETYYSKSCDNINNTSLYQLNRHLFVATANQELLNEIPASQPEGWNISSSMLIDRASILSLWHSADYDSLRLVNTTTNNNNATIVLELPLSTKCFTLVNNSAHVPLLAKLDQDGICYFYAPNAESTWEQVYSWNPSLSQVDLQNMIMANDIKFGVIRTSNDSLIIILRYFIKINDSDIYYFRYGKGCFPPSAIQEQVVVPLNASTMFYPNPFKSTLNFSMQTNKSTTATISIYNVKGQLVRRLTKINLTKGANNISWNGLDSSGQPIGNGVYLLNIDIEGKKAVYKALHLK